MTTTIEWTEESWNPIRARHRQTGAIGWHCEHASPGCENCYSETRNLSGRCNMGTKLPFKPGHRDDLELFLDEKTLLQPLRWRKPRTIFVGSMTDMFADFVTDDMLDRIMAIAALYPQHTFQMLTKRSKRMGEYFSEHRWHKWAAIGRELDAERWANLAPIMGGDCTSMPNVWLGVSVEDQKRADERILDLLATPAAIRWISAEPLLGPLRLTHLSFGTSGELDGLTGHWRSWPITAGGPTGSILHKMADTPTLDWVVCGGESGAKARPMHPDWARSLRDQCAAAGVPFFFKQWGQYAPCEISETGALNPPMPMSGPNLMKWRRWEGSVTRPAGPKEGIDTWFAEGTFAVPLGKKKSGRLLDGIEHNALPATASREAA